MPVVLGIIVYRGFCLGYTISALVSVLGAGRGISFVLANLVLQNIILIPAILAMAVSCFKLCKSIFKDKRRENIKIEIVRHTLFCGIMAGVVILASVIEVFISNNLLKMISKYL